jgi:hypothetical protein
MLRKTLLSVSLLVAFAAQAQTTPAPAATAPAAPSAPAATSSPAKKDLIARILKAQQSAIEAMARGLVERPALEIMSSAMQAIPSRIAKDKQESVARDIQSDAQKYVDEVSPIVQRRAVAIAPTTIGAVLEEKFSEDELKQIASMLENPALVKYQGSVPAMQQALGEKLVADTRPQVEPKVRALEEQVGKRLGLSASGAAPATPAAPANKKK